MSEKKVCTKCGDETIWADLVCSWCKKEAGETVADLMLASMPPQGHTLRRIGGEQQ